MLASLLFKSYFNDVPSILDKPKVCTFLLLRTENEHLFTCSHSSTYWVDIGYTVVGTEYLGEKAKKYYVYLFLIRTLKNTEHTENTMFWLKIKTIPLMKQTAFYAEEML